jgi:hypothetical protein
VNAFNFVAAKFQILQEIILLHEFLNSNSLYSIVSFIDKVSK